MLCCWLQQLQEFGGPEVDKPDLLKGSIGSLKNLGLVNNTSSATSTTTSTAPAVTSTVTTTSNIKANVSTSGSIIKHNPCLDKRARYNVCIYIYVENKQSKLPLCDTMTHILSCCHYIYAGICLFCQCSFSKYHV